MVQSRRIELFKETTCLEHFSCPHTNFKCYYMTDKENFKRRHCVECLPYFINFDIDINFTANVALKNTTYVNSDFII